MSTVRATRGPFRAKLGRVQDFAELRARGLTIGEAAARLGVTRRTGDRYARITPPVESTPVTVALAYLPKWQGVGLCVDEPTLMYPSNDHDLRRARSVCRACPVMAECKTWVMGLPYEADPGGVVAGLTLAERARIAGLIPAAKVCPGCEEELPYTAYALISRGRPRLKAYCRACEGRAQGARRAEPEEEVDALPGEAHKVCPRCKITRGVSRYYPNRKNPDGLSVWCKPCLFESLRGNE